VTSIGRLEVGTETLLDKSKSVKTVLMQLFKDNTNIEGADTINACYGGTSALFNAINWVESSAWDGRDSIVVAGDIAVYEKGPARPSGGAGIVAMLIGPNAPLVIDAGLRGSYMRHDYDFYKPDPSTEYPVINGHYSLQCYIEALDGCYKAYLKRQKTLAYEATFPISNGYHNGTVDHKTVYHETILDQFDHFIFHSPVCKLVRKAYARLLFNDYLVNPKATSEFEDVPSSFRDMDYAQSLGDRAIETTFLALTKKKFHERVEPSLEVANMCGNLYCGSVYGSLASLLSNVDSSSLQGKKIGIFSHGGGLASSMFSLTVVGSTEKIQRTLCLKERLAARTVETPETYTTA
jgi:hydroxymethylglutaryl-CoA synthase